MIQATRNLTLRKARAVHTAWRGVLLSHLVGLCFFMAFILGPALPRQILFTRVFDWPIRILALWLLVDRLGKVRRYRFSAWDWAHLLFIAGYGCALVYAELFMTRDTGLLNYLQWTNTLLSGYFYFVVVREGASRRGFEPAVVVRWILSTLVVACLLGLAQARDVAGMRAHIDNFYHQADIELHMEGPSQPWQARAPATHANSLAIMLVCGLPLFVALADMKRLKWFDWIAIALMVFTVFMTFSRIGIISMGAVGGAVIIAMAVRKDYARAAVATLSVVSLAVAFVAIVNAFDIERFKVLVDGSGRTTLDAQETAGWTARRQSLNRALTLAARYPIVGLNAASAALNEEGSVVKNAYTYPGLLLNVYAFAFVSYGLLGIGFMAALFWLIISEIRFARSSHVFATAAFVLGVGLVVGGIAENTLFFDGAMITTNIVMAFCVMRVSRGAPELGSPAGLRAAGESNSS